jgi:MarR family transcriptional regulator, transcriptional regulator for hemolysin
MKHTDPPIGFVLAQTAKRITRNFEAALIAAGGALPHWLVLISLQKAPSGLQSDLAESVGVQGPTLTHHLNAMETAGLITRTRTPADRRAHTVEITKAGQRYFEKMRVAAEAFDAKLNTSITKSEMATLRATLAKLATASDDQ